MFLLLTLNMQLLAGSSAYVIIRFPITATEFLLTRFVPLLSFETPWKKQKTFGFLVFSGGMERDQWHEMG